MSTERVGPRVDNDMLALVRNAIMQWLKGGDDEVGTSYEDVTSLALAIMDRAGTLITESPPDMRFARSLFVWGTAVAVRRENGYIDVLDPEEFEVVRRGTDERLTMRRPPCGHTDKQLIAGDAFRETWWCPDCGAWNCYSKDHVPESDGWIGWQERRR